MSSRVNTQAFAAAVAHSLALRKQADDVLAPFLVDLTEEQRRSLSRPADAFPDRARRVAEGMGEFSEVALAAGYDREEVLEDLDNVNQIARLQDHTDAFQRRLADTRLVWLSEAYSATLAVYNVARTLVKTKPALSRIIDALKSIFSSRRRSDEG
jgi:hypothetical protein